MKKSQIGILNIVTVMLVLASTGGLNSAEAEIEETHGVITISFDDNMQNQFDYAYPLMKARGIVGTFYAVTDHIHDFSGDSQFMSINELQILQADGNEIGSHSKTHPHFASLTEEQIRSECNSSKNVLQSYGLHATNFAYPYGDRNATTDAIVSQYYHTGRPSWSAYTTPLPITNFLIVGTSGETGNPDILSLLQNFVDKVYTADEWGVIYFHNVIPNITNDPYTISQQDFESFLDYIKYKDMPTVTVDQALDLMSAPTPPLSASINPISTSMHIGESQVFTSTVKGDNQPYSYQWYCNNMAVIGATNPNWTFKPNQTGQYSIYLKVTDKLNYLAQSNTITDITVYNQPSVSIYPTSTRMEIGQSQAFTSSVTGDTQPYQYQWYCNNTEILGATDPNLMFTPTQTGQYNIYLEMTDKLNYQTQSNTITDIIVYNQPIVLVSSTSTRMHVGQSQTFTSTVIGETLPYSYQWYLNDTSVTGATNASFTFTPNQTGQYNIYLKVTDNLNVQTQSNVVTDITVYPQLTISINPAAVDLTVQQSQTFTLEMTGGIAPYTYQWFQNGVAIPGANSETLTLKPMVVGEYTIYLQVTDNSTAIAQSNKITVEVTMPFTTSANQKGDNVIFFENWQFYILASVLVAFILTVCISKSFLK